MFFFGTNLRLGNYHLKLWNAEHWQNFFILCWLTQVSLDFMPNVVWFINILICISRSHNHQLMVGGYLYHNLGIDLNVFNHSGIFMLISSYGDHSQLSSRTFCAFWYVLHLYVHSISISNVFGCSRSTLKKFVVPKHLRVRSQRKTSNAIEYLRNYWIRMHKYMRFY